MWFVGVCCGVGRGMGGCVVFFVEAVDSVLESLEDLLEVFCGFGVVVV